MFYIGLMIGFVAGILVMKNWDVVSDWVETLKDRLPDTATMTEKLPAVGAFLKKNAIPVVIGIFVVAVLVFNFWPKAPETPAVKIGQPITMLDACGTEQILTLTQEDVGRGSVVIGSITQDGQDCRRVLKLGTK